MAIAWADCKNILCIRPDTMGDVIMCGPAIRAVKASFAARITLLTSATGGIISPAMAEVDETIIFDAPWAESSSLPKTDEVIRLVSLLQSKKFDAAVVFSDYSEDPMPSIMLAYMAGIPKRLAYCRENPHGLLSDWVPDKEPYRLIKHQVQRDIDLVKSIGAQVDDDMLSLTYTENLWPIVRSKVMQLKLDMNKPWLIMHAGVSDKAREYPFNNWVSLAKMLIHEKRYQVLLTGSAGEQLLTEQLQAAIGPGSFAAGGVFYMDEFICLLKHCPVLIAPNTGVVHVASAVSTPVVVLYAQTSPQTTPWKTTNKILQFSAPLQHDANNEVIAYVNKKLYQREIPPPSAQEVYRAVNALVSLTSEQEITAEL